MVFGWEALPRCHEVIWVRVVGRVGGLGIQRLTSRICFGWYFAGALHLLLHEIMRNHGKGAIEMNIAAHIVAPILVFRAVLKG